MAAVSVTTAEATAAAALQTLLADALKDGTSGGVTIVAPIPLTAIPQSLLDLYKIVAMMTIRACSQLPVYTVGTLPTVTNRTGQMIYVSDEAGGAVPAFCDGTNWRRVTDRAIVS